jgi:hypothetical protein
LYQEFPVWPWEQPLIYCKGSIKYLWIQWIMYLNLLCCCYLRYYQGTNNNQIIKMCYWIHRSIIIVFLINWYQSTLKSFRKFFL